MTQFCCWSFLWLFALSAGAQEPRFFQHFTEKDGLSSNDVTCILRDREGYLWVGTNYGLNRYDGRTFRQYLPNSREPDQTVCNEYITALALDARGLVWIATRNGLNCYNPQTRRFATWQHTGLHDGSLPNNLVTDILPDGKRLWLACDNRDLVCFDPDSAVFKTFPWKKYIETALPETASKDYKTIYGLRNKSENALWLLTNLGLAAFDKNTEQFEVFPTKNKRINPYRPELQCAEPFFFDSRAYDILCLDPCRRAWSQMRLPLRVSPRDDFRQATRVQKAGDRYWVLAQQGLFYFKAENGKVFPVKAEKNYAESAPEGAMQALFADCNGLLWFGGENGLWLLDPALQHFQYQPLGLKPEAVFNNRYNHVLDVPELQRRFVSDLYRGQLLVMDGGRRTKTISLGGPAHVLKRGEKGQIWVSAGMKLFQIDARTLQRRQFAVNESLFNPGENSCLNDFDIDSDGNYWFAGNDCGVLIFYPKENRWSKPGVEQDFISQNINCLYTDLFNETVWIGTEDYGLYRYDQKTAKFKLYRHENARPDGSLPAFMVRDVGFYRNGYLWLATDPGGVSRFDYNAPEEGAFCNFNTDHGLPSNQVCSIAEDGSGRLWFGTTKGLAAVDRVSGLVISWNKSSGLRNEYLDLPLSFGADGMMYAGGAQGLEYFDPDSLLSFPFDGRLMLNSFKVFDRELIGTFDTDLTLPWHDNFFSVDFASAHFSFPDRVQYHVQLERFDKFPLNIGSVNHASWTNVPPGRYCLKMFASAGGKTSALRSVNIVITPPFWKTWWFGLIAFSLLSALLYGFYRYRIGQIKREEALKTEFNRRLAEVEMTALRAQMNPHFVFNCLNSINRFILVNEPEAASGYLTRFSRLIRLILDNSRSETVSLDKELEALRLYVEMESMRFEGRFEYEISVDPALQPEHLEIPPLLIQPFVENAVWHGLMHRKTPGKLRVRIAPLGRGLWIQVEDNGVGRARAQELKSKSAQTHKSQGMKLTNERLDMIRALYGVQADVEIEDLFTTAGSPAGTRVNIRISAL